MPMVNGSEKVCKFCLRATLENNDEVALKQRFRRIYVRSEIVETKYRRRKILKRDILPVCPSYFVRGRA